MKISKYLLPLKIVLLISVLISVYITIFNGVAFFQSHFNPDTPGLKAAVLQNTILGLLYLVMTWYLFRLLIGAGSEDIISRKNLSAVKGILLVLSGLLLTKIVFAWIAGDSIKVYNNRLYFRLLSVLGATWELLMAFMVILALAIVFERAVSLKEEQALTI